MVVVNREKTRKSLGLASSGSNAKGFKDIEDINYEELKQLYHKLKQHIDLIEKTEESKSIPVSVFIKNLSPLETVSKYLHENFKLNYKDISKLINRSAKTIWQACNNAGKKQPSEFIVKSFAVTVPASLFKDRKLSILEHIVVHLKEKYILSYSKIAHLLSRDQRTVWTVYSRAQKKLGKKTNRQQKNA